MRWVKRGQIFDRDKVRVSFGKDFLFSQSPQVLEFADFVRVYFSTREKDGEKFVSQVSYVDFTKDFAKIKSISAAPVIPLGKLGTFDEHGIFPINILRHEDKIYAYTCGWSRRKSVSVETSIGFAVSNDQGNTFQKLGHGPVVSSSPNEPFLVGDAFVQFYSGQFHMWYMFGTQWKKYSDEAPPDRTYKIGHAISADGLNWKKRDGVRIVPDRLGETESQALPTVVEIDGSYHMYFCYRESFDFRENKTRGYRIGHAVSKDLLTWKRDDESLNIEPSASGWDSEMQCYPHVFKCDGKVYMLYNGNEFGKSGFGLAELDG